MAEPCPAVLDRTDAPCRLMRGPGQQQNREGAEELLRHHQHPFVQGEAQGNGRRHFSFVWEGLEFSFRKHYETARTPRGPATHTAFPSDQDTGRAPGSPTKPSRVLTGTLECQGKLTQNPRVGLHFTSTRPPAALTAQRTLGLPRGSSGATATCGHARKQASLLGSLQNRGCGALKEKKWEYRRTVSYTNHKSTMDSRGLCPVPAKGIT